MANNHLFRRKPARWAMGRSTGIERVGGGFTDTPGGVIWSVPLLEGAGGLARAMVGSLHSGRFLGNAAWGVGEIGFCATFSGATSDRILADDSTQSLRFEKQLPLSVEAIVEQIGATGTSRSVIFCNDCAATNYAGITLGVNNSQQVICNIGDGSGGTSADRRTWASTSTIALGQIYHLIVSCGGFGAGDCEIFINGHKETTAQTGTGASIGYTVNGANIGGGTTPSGDGFNGRVYMLNFLNRRIFAAEAMQRATNPWASFIKPTLRSAPVVASNSDTIIYHFMGH